MRGCVSCREMERREKVEEARRETERILAEQEAEVAKRKVSTVGEGAQRCAQQQGSSAHAIQWRWLRLDQHLGGRSNYYCW